MSQESPTATRREMPPPVHRDRLQAQIRDHLLLNFTDLADFADRDVPVFVRGDGCYVVDSAGRRFIDGELLV